MTWLRRHWKLVLVVTVIFFTGVAIGQTGGDTPAAADPGTVTQTEISTFTSSEPVQTVTDTVTKQVTVKQKPKPRPKPQTIHFSGNGGKTLPAFTVSHDATLRWTCDGAIFQLFDLSGSFSGINVNSQAHRGSTSVSAGRYSKITVNAIGNWTITIR